MLLARQRAARHPKALPTKVKLSSRSGHHMPSSAFGLVAETAFADHQSSTTGVLQSSMMTIVQSCKQSMRRPGGSFQAAARGPFEARPEGPPLLYYPWILHHSPGVQVFLRFPSSPVPDPNLDLGPEISRQGGSAQSRSPGSSQERPDSVSVNTGSPGYYSHLFVVPKPGGRWRPVIDLSRLNKHITAPKFKWIQPVQSETQSLRPSLQFQ